jgi:type IV fimbrial biogenesis protein FimT
MKICRGFTLLEVLAVIAVVAVIVGVGIPSFSIMIQNNRVTTQTNELVTALNFARTEAVKRGRNVQVAVTEETTGWSATVALAGVVADPLRVVDRQGSVVTVNAANVVFGPTGAPTAGETFTMAPKTGCSGEQRRQIVVGVSGQITTTREPCL